MLRYIATFKNHFIWVKISVFVSLHSFVINNHCINLQCSWLLVAYHTVSKFIHTTLHHHYRSSNSGTFQTKAVFLKHQLHPSLLVYTVSINLNILSSSCGLLPGSIWVIMLCLWGCCMVNPMSFHLYLNRKH